MADEVYGEKWQEDLYKKLSEKIVNRFRAGGDRGADFGRIQGRMQRVLEQLRTEIALKAEDYRAQETTKQKDFERNQGEQVRREGASFANENTRRALNYSDYWNKYNHQVMDRDRTTRGNREFKLGSERGFPKGSEYEQYNYPQNGGYKIKYVEDEEAKKKKPGYPFDFAGTTDDVGTLVSGAGSRSFNPRAYQGFNPSTPRPDSESTGGRDYFQASGDINENTPDEFDKALGDYEDTSGQIYDNTLGQIPGFENDQVKDSVDYLLNPIPETLGQLKDPISDWWGGGQKVAEPMTPNRGYNPKSGQTRGTDGKVRDINGNVIRDEGGGSQPNASPSFVPQDQPYLSPSGFLSYQDPRRRTLAGTR